MIREAETGEIDKVRGSKPKRSEETERIALFVGRLLMLLASHIRSSGLVRSESAQAKLEPGRLMRVSGVRLL